MKIRAHAVLNLNSGEVKWFRLLTEAELFMENNPYEFEWDLYPQANIIKEK